MSWARSKFVKPVRIPQVDAAVPTLTLRKTKHIFQTFNHYLKIPFSLIIYESIK